MGLYREGGLLHPPRTYRTDGDDDVTRNYSGWGIKKVKFRNYTAHGIEGAVTVKLAGRIVLTMTCIDRDALYDILYQYRRQD